MLFSALLWSKCSDMEIRIFLSCSLMRLWSVCEEGDCETFGIKNKRDQSVRAVNG